MINSIEMSPSGSFRRKNEETVKNLFVGNLDFKTTESDLRALFLPFGQLGRVHVPMDRETGRPRGFAFVEMTSDDDAKKAIAALDGKEIGGRNVKVNEARPKEHGGPPNRGGGNRGSGGYGHYDSSSRDSYEGAARQPREPRW
jgi:cold-inducible RNA-binding protein